VIGSPDVSDMITLGRSIVPFVPGIFGQCAPWQEVFSFVEVVEVLHALDCIPPSLEESFHA